MSGTQASAFNEKKATQAAAYFLKLAGSDMDYLRLMKLMYLMERASLIQRGRPVTYDKYYSLTWGPVLSRVLDLVHRNAYNAIGYWEEHIGNSGTDHVFLRADPGGDLLSRSELRFIDSVFGSFGEIDGLSLAKLTHNLPEWKDPNGSSIPITIAEILTAGGKSSEDAQAISAEVNAVQHFRSMFGSR